MLLTSYEMLAAEAGPLSRGLSYGVLLVDEVCVCGGVELGVGALGESWGVE